MAAARKPAVVGNWKMNGNRSDAVALAKGVHERTSALLDTVDVGVCPPSVYLPAVIQTLCDAGSDILVGAQNAHHEASGAYTGEIAPAMLTDIGAKTCIIGHSERRHGLGETDEFINKKVASVLGAGLTCILCIGELLEERERGETDAVNERQLRKGLEGISLDASERLIVAYEPVWAIGTGKTATPDDAQAAHKAIRGVLSDVLGAQHAEGIRIQYGGSMKPGNAAELLAQPDIDGGLIGGASLKPDDFAAIVEAAA